VKFTDGGRLEIKRNGLRAIESSQSGDEPGAEYRLLIDGLIDAQHATRIDQMLRAVDELGDIHELLAPSVNAPFESAAARSP
jgi:hypothetical protein